MHRFVYIHFKQLVTKILLYCFLEFLNSGMMKELYHIVWDLLPICWKLWSTFTLKIGVLPRTVSFVLQSMVWILVRWRKFPVNADERIVFPNLQSLRRTIYRVHGRVGKAEVHRSHPTTTILFIVILMRIIGVGEILLDKRLCHRVRNRHKSFQGIRWGRVDAAMYCIEFGSV